MEDNVINMLFRYSDIFDLWIAKAESKNPAALHCAELLADSEQYNKIIELGSYITEYDQDAVELECDLEDVCMEMLVKSIVQLSDNAFLDELLQTKHSEYVLQFVTKN